MSVLQSPKRRTRKSAKTVVARPPLSPADQESLRDFVVHFALGDGHLTAWEENFLNNMKHLLYQPTVRPSAKQQAIIRQLKDRMHYDRQHVPLPPIDPDGLEANDDPDGWPARRQAVDAFDDDELLATLTEA